MPASKAQQKATAKYEARVYDKTLIRLPKGQLEEVKDHAAAHGESVNGFIGRAISETMQRDAQPVAGHFAGEHSAQPAGSDLLGGDGGGYSAPVSGGVSAKNTAKQKKALLDLLD